MPEPTPSTLTFAAIAQRVMWRVWLRRWLALLGRSVWPVSGVLAVAGILMWSAGFSATPTIIWLCLFAWLAGCAVMVWRNRPGAFSALALWDQVKGRREAFAAAWWFEQQSSPLT